LTHSQCRYILQYSVKIANYDNKVFKNVAGYANLALFSPYFTKIIINPFKAGLRPDGGSRNFSV
jgi:hypothetical protein